jgi:hypothetical protein
MSALYYLSCTDRRQRDCLSLDSASISLPTAKTFAPEEQQTVRVDLPMRSFAGGFYLNLQAMYGYLGIKYHAQRFLYVFSNARSDSPYFVHASSLHRIIPPRPPDARFGPWLVEVLYLAICYLYWSICCLLIPPSPFEPTSSQDCETLTASTYQSTSATATCCLLWQSLQHAHSLMLQAFLPVTSSPTSG